jgi:antitoxin VapB
MQSARVFQRGRSQAIRLPREFQINGSKVFLKKTADGFLVILRDPWEIFLEGAEELSDDFMSAVRRQRSNQKQFQKG